MIAPSRPMLITPLRSVTHSPSAASASGVAVRTAAARKSSSGVIMPVLLRRLLAARAVTGNDEQDEHRFHHVHERDRHTGVALHGVAAGLQRTEEHRRADHAERVQPREQRHGDGGVAVARD